MCQLLFDSSCIGDIGRAIEIIREHINGLIETGKNVKGKRVARSKNLLTDSVLIHFCLLQTFGAF